MGGRGWTKAEEQDLATLSHEEFRSRWHRTDDAILDRRRRLGLGTGSNTKLMSRPALPKCTYCTTKTGDCTCDQGHFCLDTLCMYY